MKSYFKSKTVWVGFAVVVLGGIETVMTNSPIPPEYNGMITAAIGAVMVYLRSITTEAVGSGS